MMVSVWPGVHPNLLDQDHPSQEHLLMVLMAPVEAEILDCG